LKMFSVSKQQAVRLIYHCLIIAACCFTFSSCNKDSFIKSPGATISTSADTVKFDTVFTSIGSLTQSFKINNTNSQKLLFSSIKLAGGNTSPYKININGVPESQVSDVELAANDSLYVFVTVRIDPNLSGLPFIVKDSVEINYNGNSRFVQLEAYGQNANFLRNGVIRESRTWGNNLPYVILGSLQVDTNITLTIDPGCRIYSHASAPILVDGTLIINGTRAQPVIFAGDRLDEDYKDLPASWPGIYFREFSKDNFLNFTVVKNAYRGVVSEYLAANGLPKVTMQQCIIDNAYDAGLLFVNSSFDINNSLISNCGNNISIILGGDYKLTNCTVASYSTYVNHKNPVLSANNFAMVNGSNVSAGLNAVFKNCIFWAEEGNLVKDEVVIEKVGTDPFKVLFDHCIYKATNDPANSIITESIKNINPLFDSIDVSKRIFDFHISNNLAPGINNGTVNSFLKDLDDKERNAGLPDIGCYEQQ
jgi:uncharacterized membrane protein YwzB